MATKFGTKLAITRLASEIFVPVGGFSGMGHQMPPIAFFPTNPCCHGNKIWDKTGYSSACVRDFCKIFAPIGGLLASAIQCCQSQYPTTDPCCHGYEIWDKVGYNSACVRDICTIVCICGGVFRNRPSNAANWILPWPTLVAMATKFKTKWSIPHLVQQISPRSLHLTMIRVEGLAIRWHQSKSTTANLDFQV